MLPKPIQGRCFMKNLLRITSWVNRLQSFSLPPHPSWKAFKVCEAGGLCSKPWDCLQQAPFYRCLLHSYHFQWWPSSWLWRPAPTLHGQDSDINLLYWPDETAGKALNKVLSWPNSLFRFFHYPNKLANSKIAHFQSSGLTIRKQGHGTKLVFNQLAVTPQPFLLLFEWLFFIGRVGSFLTSACI